MGAGSGASNGCFATRAECALSGFSESGTGRSLCRPPLQRCNGIDQPDGLGEDTMSQEERALAFGALHRKGDPVVLYNIWDAGSAQCVAEAGAKALATGSWSVAAAHGYGDVQ